MKRRSNTNTSIKNKKPIFKIVTLSMVGLLTLITIGTTSYSFYLFNKTNPESTTLTAQQISELTRYNPKDNNIISTIKTNALSENLATGSTDLLIKLKNAETQIRNIQTGKIPKTQLQQTLAQLKSDFQLSDNQIGTLETAFNTVRLKTLIDRLNSLSNSGTISDMSEIESISNEIYTTTKTNINNYIKDSNAEYPVYMNDVVSALTTLTNKLDNLKSFITLFSNPKTLDQQSITDFGQLSNFTKPYSNQFDKLKTFVTSRDQINQHILELKEFKDQIDTSNELIKNSIPTPDLIGKTIKQARQIAKDQFNITIKDGYETGDSEIITAQDVTKFEYDRIKKGSTIILETKLKKVEPPKESSSSTPSSTSSTSETSNSSTSSSNTTSSSSSNNDTDHSDEDIHDPNYNFDDGKTSTTERKQ